MGKSAQRAIGCIRKTLELGALLCGVISLGDCDQSTRTFDLGADPVIRTTPAAVAPSRVASDMASNAPPAAAASVADSLIVPGRGIGPFQKGMTRAQIEKLLKPEETGEGESDGKPALTAYFMDAEKRVTMRLDAHNKVIGMLLHGDRAPWHDAHGVTLGSTLQTLEKLNGKPLRVHAFDDSAKSGQVIDWGGGALAKEYTQMKITFASPMHAAGYAKLSAAQKSVLEKQRDFPSNAAELQALDPIIETIELSF